MSETDTPDAVCGIVNDQIVSLLSGIDPANAEFMVCFAMVFHAERMYTDNGAPRIITVDRLHGAALEMLKRSASKGPH